MEALTKTTNPMAFAARAEESSACFSAVPDENGYVPPGACDSNYNFYPSFGGNLAFTVLFVLSMMAHLIQAVAYKKRFCWVVIMACAWETAAFAIRSVGAKDQQNSLYPILGQVIFLLAPLWINAFAYMTVARMVHYGLEEKKVWGIRGSRMTLLFVWLDVFCFIVQGVGGVLLSNNENPDLIDTGKKIYMAGIGVQLAFVIIFVAVTAWFYRLMHLQADGRINIRMRLLIWTMLVVLALIIVRIVFRLVEFSDGNGADNPLTSEEIYAFMLDAFPMLLAMVLLNAMHPALVLRGPDSEFPRYTRAEKKAMKAQDKADKQRRKAAKKARKDGLVELQPAPYEGPAGCERASMSDGGVEERSRMV